jgi:hypothetical protein
MVFLKNPSGLNQTVLYRNRSAGYVLYYTSALSQYSDQRLCMEERSEKTSLNGIFMLSPFPEHCTYDVVDTYFTLYLSNTCKCKWRHLRFTQQLSPGVYTCVSYNLSHNCLLKPNQKQLRFSILFYVH